MTDTLDDLGWVPFFADQVTDDDAGLVPMRIAAVHRSRLMAETGGGQVRLDLPIHASTADYAVGDWVLARDDTRVVARLLDRRALLRRRTEGADARQLIAANVDTLFVVTSCNDDFNPARLERYLALANEAGTDPVIVLTKIDKVDDPSEWIDRARTLQRGLQVVALNAKSPDAAAMLEPWCGSGRTVALVGSSGVGKSTLLNTLSGSNAQATGDIRESDAKGRHTTTSRSLHPVAGGGWVIDTPGMRTLHVADIAVGIEMLFAEITELAPDCRFRDCTHAHEPGCAVQAAVRAGTLDADRLERWRKLHDENRDNTPVQTGPRGNRTTLPRGSKRR
ncbi:ribosome small subunit-dependent GTPase A [Paracoccus sp. Ld10]|uniref:ribosome small subunit-dependent GTPase A n=1 Tax=Paracoccus sp. Ld10 TaxID=649158 RepID=UPI00386649D9